MGMLENTGGLPVQITTSNNRANSNGRRFKLIVSSGIKEREWRLVITCGLEAGKFGISSQSSSESDSKSSSSILSTLVGFAVRFRSFGACVKKLLILADPAAALRKVASFLYRVARLVLV